MSTDSINFHGEIRKISGYPPYGLRVMIMLDGYIQCESDLSHSMTRLIFSC